MARVLVIDDEPLVAEMVRRTLEDDFEVRVVYSGRAALELVEQEVFDAILTDLAMPDVDGISLHEKLSAKSPPLAAKMLFLSGGATTPRAREFLARPGVRSLEKPFRADELLRRVRETAAT